MFRIAKVLITVSIAMFALLIILLLIVYTWLGDIEREEVLTKFWKTHFQRRFK